MIIFVSVGFNKEWDSVLTTNSIIKTEGGSVNENRDVRFPLIISAVDLDGRYFYGEIEDYDPKSLSDYAKNHYIKQLRKNYKPEKTDMSDDEAIENFKKHINDTANIRCESIFSGTFEEVSDRFNEWVCSYASVTFAGDNRKNDIEAILCMLNDRSFGGIPSSINTMMLDISTFYHALTGENIGEFFNKKHYKLNEGILGEVEIRAMNLEFEYEVDKLGNLSNYTDDILVASLPLYYRALYIKLTSLRKDEEQRMFDFSNKRVADDIEREKTENRAAETATADGAACVN